MLQVFVCDLNISPSEFPRLSVAQFLNLFCSLPDVTKKELSIDQVNKLVKQWRDEGL